MNSKFNPGDLALTKVFDADVPAGSQVELTERIEKGAMVRGKGYFRAPSPGWYVIHRGSGVSTAYADNELIPLSGESEPEERQVRVVLA